MTAVAPSMLGEIESYWGRRAPSYSEEVRYEMQHENEENWMRVLTGYLEKAPGLRVLDIGTGPVFFAIGLAKRGYRVTAVDYTWQMLAEARKNAGALAEEIDFRRMDAQELEFESGSFDAIVTRNLTWNLEHPGKAYKEWYRVLGKGGILLNFDAAWYAYLFDEEKEQERQYDHAMVEAAGVKDFNAYPESSRMEEISRKLLLSRCKRPETDLEMLREAGFQTTFADMQVGERVWDEREKINFASTPLFMLYAKK